MHARGMSAGLAIVFMLASPTIALADETIEYTYDAKGRLVKVERSGSVNDGVDTEYTYDDADNRTEKDTSGSSNPPPP